MENRLSSAVESRKARLAQLKSLKRKQPTDASDIEASHAQPPPPDADGKLVDEPEESISAKILSGRNYDPETRGPKLGFDTQPQLTAKVTLEEQAAAVEQEVRAQAEADAAQAEAGTGIDLSKLRPKKPNWDLRRDLDRKLEPLNIRTNNAIARIVRERLAEEAKKKRQEGDTQGDVEAGALDGRALVEGLKTREAEEAEEERREREELEEL
jgi:coiled-coil domain-containing protein 12